MFEVRLLIVLVVLSIYTYQDIKNRQINISIMIVAFGIWILSSCVLVQTGRSVMGGDMSMISVLIGAIPGLFVILLSKVTKGIGDGDGYVFIFLGLMLGIWNTVTIIYISALLASLYAIIMLLAKKSKRGDAMPFLPFIMMGTIICQIL